MTNEYTFVTNNTVFITNMILYVSFEAYIFMRMRNALSKG